LKEKFDYKIYNWSIEDGDYERDDENEETLFFQLKEQMLGNIGYILVFLLIIIAGVLFSTDII